MANPVSYRMNDYLKSIILIPTLNERDNLKKLIPGIFGFMPDISVLIVDDNSKDGTQELITSMTSFKNLFILSRKNHFGYGRSSIDGFKWAFGRQYDYIITMDADFSHDFHAVPSLMAELNLADIVVGSRYIRGGGVKNWNFFRRLLSRFANIYARTILGFPITDLTTGFNAYQACMLRKIDFSKIRSEGYAFLIELKYRLLQANCCFVECPILFSERREGQSKMSPKIIWEAIWLPWKIKLLRRG